MGVRGETEQRNTYGTRSITVPLLPTAQVLLITHVFIGGDKDIETSGLGRGGEQVAIAESVAAVEDKPILGVVKEVSSLNHQSSSALTRWHSILNWTATVIVCETSWCPENVASSTEIPMSKPTVLLLGVTGQLGNLIAEKLRSDKSISLRVCARDDKKLSRLRSEFEQAVKLDLDDPRTFGSALEGVDRVFLLTGYTFAMVTQSKTFVDAARKAKVQHLVHLEVFTPEFDCTDPHFAWHQMIEAYTKQSGIPWTFLHQNVFMQNLTGLFSLVKDGKVRWWCGDKLCGWIALEDVAEAAAKILSEGEKVSPHRASRSEQQ